MLNIHRVIIYIFFFQNLSEKPSSSKTSEKQETLSMEPCCWTSLCEPFTDPDQSPTDALHRPVPNVSSEAIVSGEAVYIDDMPALKGKKKPMLYYLFHA